MATNSNIWSLTEWKIFICIPTEKDKLVDFLMYLLLDYHSVCCLPEIQIAMTGCLFPGDPLGEESAAVQETWVWSLGWEEPLEKETATHSGIPAWRIPWTEVGNNPRGRKESDMMSDYYCYWVLLQYSYRENPMGRGAWQATTHEVSKQLAWLSDWAHTYTSFPQRIPLAQCTPTRSQQSH